jgi:galactokinase
MWRATYKNLIETRGVREFVDLLNTLKTHRSPFASDVFDSKADLIVSRAPGRLDVMGGIADYSGSHVLEFPLAEATFAAVQVRPDRRLHVATLLADQPHDHAFSLPLKVFDGPVEYETAREFFQRDPANLWMAYIAGAFLVLMRECNVNFASGANILISSRVPPGKGVSSSAALEVAVMQAVAEAFNIELEPRDVALLCQKVENLVVGAPCGVMDQMTAVFGERDRLMLLLCQPAEVKQMIALPRQLTLWGIDSGVRHSVSGNSYREVRAATFSGSEIITETGRTNYLANISPAEFERDYRARLPEAIRIPTAHPIYENARVLRFVDLLDKCESAANSGPIFNELGELMYESHRAYTALGLNSAGTDLLVDLVRKEGPRAGLYGAKITGGGSGGTVAVLGDQASQPAIDRVVAAYANETGHKPYVFSDSSSGSLAFGHLSLRKS